MFESLKSKFEDFVETLQTKEISQKDLENALSSLEISLLQSDVSLRVVEKLKEELKEKLLGERLKLTGSKREFILKALRDSILEILKAEDMDLQKIIEENIRIGKPTVLLFIGFNGTGKTTTIAKLSNLLKKKFSVVIAASDTFRAGSIQQLEKHAKKVGVKMIKHDYGADPAAVAYDAIAHAKARGVNVVLIDTAGRTETNRNLMQEMKKIRRVTNPDLTIFVGDALAGNAILEQVERFSEVGIDASILTKIDADARGGAALSIAYLTGKPIIYVCDGQDLEDIKNFDKKWFMERLV
ncbi:MAG: signal recognition particle-docking protein FtsY [Candidatus Methanofastidiosia archaeon]